MRIKDLDENTKILALRNQKNFRGKENPNDYIATSFSWKDSPEGEKFWKSVVSEFMGFVPEKRKTSYLEKRKAKPYRRFLTE